MPERQLQPEDSDVPPIWGTHAESSPLDIIVFSKDRACQLDALLRSVREFFDFPHRIYVLYTTSSQEFELGYDLLRKWHPGVNWVGDEGVFGLSLTDLIHKVDSGPGRYLMFLVDDMLFTRIFTARGLMESLDDDEDILAVALRMGESITYCYVRDIKTIPPDFSKRYRWTWRGAHTGYWNYPMSLDAHIYRKTDITKLLPKLRFMNPNTLEATLAGHPLSRPDMVCEASPCVVNVVANRVQSTYKNRCGNISAEFLNKNFLQGKAIDIRPFTNRVYDSCHIEEDLPLIKDERTRAPAGIEEFERDGKPFLRINLREIPIFILNCKDDTEKRMFMHQQMVDLGLNFEFIKTLQAKPGWVGVALGHMKVLRLSRARPPFMILEDDCVFNENFRHVIEVPASAEALYLGASIFGIETPGQMGWGKANKATWERFDDDYLRVYNMLARHALLYLDENFQKAAIESQIEALTNRNLPHMGDIGMAMLQKTHVTLLTERSMCRQINRASTNLDLAEELPANEIGSDGSKSEEPAKPKSRVRHNNRAQGTCIISRRYRFIYFDIGKNASSTLIAEFSKPRYQSEEVQVADLKTLELDEYLKFTFLRDPVTRFLSAYQEISLRGDMNDNLVNKRPFMELEDNSERFNAFVSEVKKNKWDTHVTDQGYKLGNIPMDFYGRVERLQEDLLHLYKQLNMGTCPDLPMRRSRAGRKSEYAYNKFNIDHNLLSPEEIKHIRDIYREDIELVETNCPEPPLLWDPSTTEPTSQAMALAIERQGKVAPIELFSTVNARRGKCMVYCFGDRGFYAEVTTVARAMIYAWEHGYQLLLDSRHSAWSYKQGWGDYFKPFCREYDPEEADQVVEHIEFQLGTANTDFNRLRAFMPEELAFGKTRLTGFQEIIAFFTRMIFQPTADCQKVVDQLTASLELPDEYESIHVRRGDKVGDEDVHYPVETYLGRLERIPPGRTLFMMSDDWQAVKEVRDHIDAQGALINVVSLVEPERAGFDVWELRKGEDFIGAGNVKNSKSDHAEYTRDNTRMLIAETLIAAGSQKFVSTWLSNVGRIVWFLHPKQTSCTLLQQTKHAEPAGQAVESPQTFWAEPELKKQLQARRKQYFNTNQGFKNRLVYKLSGTGLLEELPGLVRAMIYAFSRQRQLLLDADSLVRNDGDHWYDLLQPLIPEAEKSPSSRTHEQLSLDNDEGFKTLSEFHCDRLAFGKKTLTGFHQILGFFLQILLWPAASRQCQIDQLAESLPLHTGYDSILFEHEKDNADAADKVSLDECLDCLLPLSPDRSLYVITNDDEVFSDTGKRLAASGCRARSLTLRRSNDDQPGSDTQTLAELTVALRSRRSVSAKESPLGQLIWLMHPAQEWCQLLGPAGDRQTISPADETCVELQLRDGSQHEFIIATDSVQFKRLQTLATNGLPVSGGHAVGLLQLPLDDGRSALTLSSNDLQHLKLTPVVVTHPGQSSLLPVKANINTKQFKNQPGKNQAPEHPGSMNIEEGHLGGYIRSQHPFSLKLGWHHGDPETWTPELWRWACESLGVSSVLDVGCGEGHATAYFQEQGCRVLGIDGSVQAQRDSVIPDSQLRHDYVDGPCIPDGRWDMVWSCEFVEHVEERFSHHFLATFSCARKYIFMTAAGPGQPGWHHVNCQPRTYWIEKLDRLGFRLDEKLTDQARNITGSIHFKLMGMVFVRKPEPGIPPPESSPGPEGYKEQSLQAITPHIKSIQVNDMQVTSIKGRRFFLFLDVFVHPSRNKIVATMPFYNEDWDPAAEGIDFENVVLTYQGKRIPGTYIPHRLDSWEPCALLDFEHPSLQKSLQKHASISFRIEVGQHTKKFRLSTIAPPAYDVLMSLVIKNENRWLRHFLEYYLLCLGVDHILVYDNFTKDRDELLGILRPYQEAGKVTYIPWSYRWRNINAPRKMIAQPQQEAHSLNRFANSRWIGFLDVDEFLRLPGKSLPDFLKDYRKASVDGLSFGLRWFQYEGALDFSEIIDAPLTFRYSHRSRLGRKRQKLLVSPRRMRFLRLHTLQEDGRELQVDDSDIFFHHYCQREFRFKKNSDRSSSRDDYMLRFTDDLTLEGSSVNRPQKPDSGEAWIRHITRALAEAEYGRSGLNEAALAVDGLCGTMTRHFYNNICNFEGCNYLEIGSYRGASTVAAMFNNNINLTCIDNFSQFNGHQQQFEANVDHFTGDNHLQLITENCFDLDTSDLGPFDIYLYDGAHSFDNQYKAISHFIETLAPLSVVIIDDWNWEKVRNGTEAALRDCNVRVLYRKEIILPEVNDEATDSFNAATDSWWNGICIMLIAGDE